MDLPSLDDIDEAIKNLTPILRRTPLNFSERFNAYLKLECLQVTGSFKVRGAMNNLIIAHRNGDRRPVIAASAGNHGRGVAFASRKLGLPCTIVVPLQTPQVKVDGCKGYGATVIRHGTTFDACLAYALKMTEE